MFNFNLSVKIYRSIVVTRNRKKEKPYLERDISWMYFNRRILQEATRSHVPLLERMAFLGIYSNNLDEFFRVRVASQSRIAECMDKSAAKEREKSKKNCLKQNRKTERTLRKGLRRSCKQCDRGSEKKKIFIWYPIQRLLPNSYSSSSLSIKKS